MKLVFAASPGNERLDRLVFVIFILIPAILCDVLIFIPWMNRWESSQLRQRRARWRDSFWRENFTIDGLSSKSQVGRCVRRAGTKSPDAYTSYSAHRHI